MSDAKIRHLDRRLTEADVTAAYAAGATTWTLPYDVATDGSEGVLVVCRRDTFEALTGTTRPATNQIAWTGADLSATSVYIGVSYESSVTPGTPYPRDGQRLPQINGRVTYKYLEVLYGETTDLEVLVTPSFAAARTTTLDATSPLEGELRVPIASRNTQFTYTLKTGSPGSFRVFGLLLEGQRSGRTRRIF